MEPDFTGWATKNDLLCSDGRTIRGGAFKHQDKMKVPLVWQHRRSEPSNILGHAILEDRAFGVYTQGFFNGSLAAKDAKEAVMHGDVDQLSIYANNLTQKGSDVMHGDIVEVSLVVKGANPGARIESINFKHGYFDDEDDEAIIFTGLKLEHADNSEGAEVAEKTQSEEKPVGEKTLKEIYDSMSEEQQKAAEYMVGEALRANAELADEDESDDADDAEHSDDLGSEAETEETSEDSLAHIDQKIKEGFEEMTRNVFEQTPDAKTDVLVHDQFSALMTAAKKNNGSMQNELEHAEDYGITNIDLLFPDAKSIETTPQFIKRRTEWVNVVLEGVKHSPFAKVKSILADITADEARAKGYIKGTKKKEEVLPLLRRTTGPATIYKKQKLDRDDILDITDMDVVAWLKAEIRLMLEEEIARAILIGDGRSALDEDKIKDPSGSNDGNGIRSILHDNEIYAHKVALAPNVAPKDAVKGLIRARSFYRGTGTPTLFISDVYLTDIMLEEDKMGRALYETKQSLADKLRVSNIVTVDLFDEEEGLFAIMVSLSDYTVGSNKGGQITSFEDFDIDFNQQKYLQETRLSGALTKPKSAVVVTRQEGTAATPAAPSFEDNTITIPTTTGVVYLIDDEIVTGTVEITEDTVVEADADEGYYFPNGTTTSWSFTYTAG